MATVNTIKISQIDQAGLSSFIASTFGVQTGTSSTIHTQPESFSGPVTTASGITVSGNLTGAGPVILQSGISVNGGATFSGNLSGSSINAQSISAPNISGGNFTIGNLSLTGVPIYDSGQVSTAVLLPSGTIFGLKQFANQERLDQDASGNFMPGTGTKPVIVILCVSIGS